MDLKASLGLLLMVGLLVGCAAVPPGTLNLPPASITFLAVADAGNGNCK